MAQKKDEQTIRGLVKKAVADVGLSALLDIMLDSARSVSRFLCLRKEDLLISETESQLPLKWLVWANEEALVSDLSRIRDYRSRSGYEREAIYAEFVGVLKRLLPVDDPSIVLGSQGVALQGKISDSSALRGAGLEEYLRKLFQSQLRVKNVMRDFVEIMMDYMIILVKGGIILPQFIDQPVVHLKRMFESTSTDSGVYLVALESLFNLDLVVNQLSIYWCDECGSSPKLFASPNIERPAHLKMSCSTCGRLMKVVSFLEPSEEILDWLESQDGVLSVLVGYALEKAGVEWQSNVMKNSESDIIVAQGKREFIIEVKVHRPYLERDEEALRSTLANDFSQLARTCAFRAKSTAKSVSGALVWNQEAPDVLTKQAAISESVRKLYGGPLKFVSLSSIPRFINEEIRAKPH